MRTAARPDFRKRREMDFWRTANRCLFVLSAIGGLVFTILMFYPELRRIEEMRSTLASLQKNLWQEDLLLRQQQREDQWLKTNPEYVEMLARDKLGVMKEGE